MANIVENSRFDLAWISNVAGFFVASRNAGRQGSYLLPEPAFADVETHRQLSSRADVLESLLKEHFIESTVMKGVLQRILRDMRLEVQQLTEGSRKKLVLRSDTEEDIPTEDMPTEETPASSTRSSEGRKSSICKKLLIEGSLVGETARRLQRSLHFPRFGSGTAGEDSDADLESPKSARAGDQQSTWANHRFSRLSGILIRKGNSDQGAPRAPPSPRRRLFSTSLTNSYIGERKQIQNSRPT